MKRLLLNASSYYKLMDLRMKKFIKDNYLKNYKFLYQIHQFTELIFNIEKFIYSKCMNFPIQKLLI